MHGDIVSLLEYARLQWIRPVGGGPQGCFTTASGDHGALGLLVELCLSLCVCVCMCDTISLYACLMVNG